MINKEHKPHKSKKITFQVVPTRKLLLLKVKALGYMFGLLIMEGGVIVWQNIWKQAYSGYSERFARAIVQAYLEARKYKL